MIVVAYNGDNGIGCANSDGGDDLLQPVKYVVHAISNFFI